MPYYLGEERESAVLTTRDSVLGDDVVKPHPLLLVLQVILFNSHINYLNHYKIDVFDPNTMVLVSKAHQSVLKK